MHVNRHCHMVSVRVMAIPQRDTTKHDDATIVRMTLEVALSE